MVLSLALSDANTAVQWDSGAQAVVVSKLEGNLSGTTQLGGDQLWFRGPVALTGRWDYGRKEGQVDRLAVGLDSEGAAAAHVELTGHGEVAATPEGQRGTIAGELKATGKAGLVPFAVEMVYAGAGCYAEREREVVLERLTATANLDLILKLQVAITAESDGFLHFDVTSDHGVSAAIAGTGLALASFLMRIFTGPVRAVGNTVLVEMPKELGSLRLRFASGA